MWADFTVAAVGSLAVFATVWAAPLLRNLGKPPLDRIADAAARLALPARMLTGLAAVTALVFIVLVGHSGAQTVWGDQAASPSTTATTAATTAENYTLDQVASHNSADSRWSAIDGNVYDLTTWINRHPGGSKRIMGICGTDGTAKFNDEHGGGEVSGTLAQFKIGALTK